ncbi:MAG: hypothetical protein GXP04_10045 [Alphaproteobacteria bacterium]|nr:hypothetical protein [Alphaproteobacteria bacterium]
MLAVEKDTDNSGPDAQLALLLEFVQQELDRLAVTSDRLQGQIGELLISGGDDLPADVYQVQDIDRVSQIIHDLARFLKSVVLQVHPEWCIDATHAADNIIMSELASRLRGEQDNSPKEHAPAAVGDCLFL